MGREENNKRKPVKKLVEKPKRTTPGQKKKIDYIISHPEKVEKLMVAISNGYNYALCCKFAGITEPSFYSWRNKGKLETEKLLANEDLPVKDRIEVDMHYVKFYEEYLKNEATAEITLMNSVKEAANTDWKAATWILERRFKDGDNYVTSQKVEMKTIKSIEDCSEDELLKELEDLRKRNEQD